METKISNFFFRVSRSPSSSLSLSSSHTHTQVHTYIHTHTQTQAYTANHVRALAHRPPHSLAVLPSCRFVLVFRSSVPCTALAFIPGRNQLLLADAEHVLRCIDLGTKRECPKGWLKGERNAATG